ncbi:MAG: DUF5655 domain-containing protein, partial [Anaerolineaceae bacterium]
MTLDEFFIGKDKSRQLFEAVTQAVLAAGPFELQVSKSQIAFKAGRVFGWVWIPGRYIKSIVPLVLSVSLPAQDGSARWKQIVEPGPGRFMHHLELNSTDEVDADVVAWLAQAREYANRLSAPPDAIRLRTLVLHP